MNSILRPALYLVALIVLFWIALKVIGVLFHILLPIAIIIIAAYIVYKIFVKRSY